MKKNSKKEKLNTSGKEQKEQEVAQIHPFIYQAIICFYLRKLTCARLSSAVYLKK